MSVFAQRENRAQNRRFVSPARPDHANSRHAPAWNPYLTQQSAWGNQALQRMLRNRTIQTKLKINETGDKYEKEADQVAEQVMRMPEPDSTRIPVPSIRANDTAIQRICTECRDGGELHTAFKKDELRLQPIEYN